MYLSQKEKRRITPSRSSKQCKFKYTLTHFKTLSTSTPKLTIPNIDPSLNKEMKEVLVSERELQEQLINLKKLKQWDIDNLKLKKQSSEYLYQSLSGFYKSNQLTNEQKQLDEMHNVLLLKTNYNALMEKTNKTNKIIDYFQSLKHKEQGSILNNTIQKTKSLFNYSLFGHKTQKDIQSDLNIDIKTLNALKQREVNTQNYRKVIQEKNKYEMEERNNLMKVLNNIMNKKEMKKKKEEELSQIYIQKEKLIREYNEHYMNIREKVRLLQYNCDLKIKHNNFSKEYLLRLVSENLLKNSNMEAYEKELTEKYKTNIAEIEKRRKNCLTELKYLSEEIDNMKNISEEILKDQREYYFDILHKGYDVRIEGLVWILRRLLEMNSTLEYHHFPKILDHNEVNYIKNYAKLFLNEAQFIIILSALKKKQEEYKIQDTNKKIRKMNSFLDKLKLKNKEKVIMTDENIKKKELNMKFSIIFHKYKDNFKLQCIINLKKIGLSQW